MRGAGCLSHGGHRFLRKQNADNTFRARQRAGGRARVPGTRAVARKDPTPSKNLHVTAVRRLAAVAAEHPPFRPSLDRGLRAALEWRGILELYTHQTEAIEHALGGRAISSSTRRPLQARRSVTTHRFSIRSFKIDRTVSSICLRPKRSHRINWPSCS